ncbi:MAG TPA: S8 family serine peptidase [Verrucomicrobiota bacterium]|nr:S8 family serine peptidase [Verrucomicrobiota bacterium]
MKTKVRTATRIGTAVIALAIVSASFAQQATPPLPGTYYSAKDPDFPPFPANPHPGLPVTEVAPGIFVVDDTAVPDTPEQAATRAARKAAQERAAQIDPVTAQRLAEQSARQRRERYERDVAPLLHQGIRTAGGQPSTLRATVQSRREQARVQLPERQRKALAERQAFEEQVVRRGGLLELDLGDDRKARLVPSRGGPVYLIGHSIVAADTISTDEVLPGGTSGLNLTGNAQLMGIWDETAVRRTHWEFGENIPPSPSRVTQRDGAAALGFHTTAVAGLMSAIGLVYNPPVGLITHGMAPLSDLWAYDYDDDEIEMDAAATEGLELSNHSYGAGTGWHPIQGAWFWFGHQGVNQTIDYQFGYYSARAQTIDDRTVQFPDYLTVWSAGNEQNQGPAVQPVQHWYRPDPIAAPDVWNFPSVTVRDIDGDDGGYDTMTPEASAKNILSVGAVEDIVGGYNGPASVVLAGFSSIGPTDDGRIKPDVVANGVTLTTPAHDGDNLYFINNPAITGTSFAAPSVTGSIALLAELHGQLRPTAMRLLASTLKGLVIHTADEAGPNPGPDFRHGWGLMNTLAAAELIEADAASESRPHLKEVLLENGSFIEFPVVSNGNEPLRVTICWSDPAGPVDAVLAVDPMNARLVNDLDLRVINPSAGTHAPWLLNPDLANQTAAARAAAATTGDNIRDNVEQVQIANPTAGTYTVRVTHKGNLQNGDPQWVSILVSGNVPQPKPELRFIGQQIAPSGDFAVIWQGVVGQRYQVQYRNNVEGPGWTDIGPEVSAAKESVAVELPVDPQQPHRFFRVMEVE